MLGAQLFGTGPVAVARCRLTPVAPRGQLDDHAAAMLFNAMLRAITQEDLPAVLALNNAHAEQVNALTADALANLFAASVYARLVEGDRGFLLALDERLPAQGPNHAWFQARYPAFRYIDRIVIAPEARGLGLARQLYEDLAATAPELPLCCEVNIAPPNPGSLVFHDRLGFAPCGEADDPRNGKRVRYLIRRPT